MKALKDHRGNVLGWVRPKALRRYYELRSGGEVFATLTWPKAFGSLANGECTEGKYSMKRGGFLHPFVTVRKQPFDSEYAKLQIDFRGNGTLQFIDGRTFQFQKLSRRRPHWGFSDVGGKLQCSTLDKPGLLKESGEARIEADARMSPHLIVMLMLAWYVITLRRDEESYVGFTMATGLPP